MKPYLPLIAFVCFLFSCSPKTETDQTALRDSVSSSSTATVQSPAPVYDPADSGTFKGLVDLFQGPATELPEWAISFISDDGGGRVTSEKILQKDPVYLFLCLKFEPVGPGVDALHAVSFTKDGTPISDVWLAESYPSAGPDGGGKDFKYEYDESKKVIKISDITIEWSEEDQQELTDEVWFYYYLDAHGKIVTGRKYPQVSQRLLSADDFSSLSKEELKIMRNEIFASYGYIFKTESLKSYFAAMPWYNPEHENVDDYLTKIEKLNIALIKQAEESK